MKGLLRFRVLEMRDSILSIEVLEKILFLLFRMNFLFFGHLSEAEVWTRPWVEQVGLQVGNFWVWVVDRQVVQTGILEQVGSFLR